MTVFKMLSAYFLPSPPSSISEEEHAAFQADLDDAKWTGALGSANRAKVDVWVRHSGNLARAENRVWLRNQGWTFVRRWAFLSAVMWMGAAAVSGLLWMEIPLTLLGYLTGCGTLFILWLKVAQ